MQPKTQTLCLSEHLQSTDPAADSCGANGTHNESWRLVNGLSKDPVENWKNIGSSSTSGTIYFPNAPNSSPSSEGIIVNALNVLKDGASQAMTLNAEFASLKKIAKKRRKQNGGVDVEHTKSSKEFLRKAQQSLRDLSVKEVDDHPLQQGPIRASSVRAIQPDNNRRDMMIAQHNASKSCSSVPALSNANETESNPYGYEDPDDSIPQAPRRTGGLARRRNSVTKYSVQAMAAAKAATERLQNLGHGNTLFRRSNSASNVTTSAPRQNGMQKVQSARQLGRTRMPLERSVGVMMKQQSDRTLKTGDSLLQRMGVGSFEGRGILRRPKTTSQDSSEKPKTFQSQPNQLSLGEAALRRLNPGMLSPEVPTVSMEPPSRSTPKATQQEVNRYGYGEMGEANGKMGNSNPYGYGEMEEEGEEHSKPKLSTNDSNPYGYGDPDSQPRPRMPGMAKRRGSVTKFSISAQAQVIQDHARTHLANMKSIIPMAVDTSNSSAASSMPAPPPVQNVEVAMEENIIWQPLKPESSSSSFPKKRLGRRTTARPGKPRPVVRSDSFRSNDDLDSSSSESSSHSDSDSDDSLDDSIGMDAPMAAPKLPTRHDSFRSFSTRKSDSGRSLDSDEENDGDSLAPDMQSLCSISQRDERTLEPTFSGGLRKTFSNTPTRTPRALSQKNSGSFREIREKLRGNGGINMISFPVDPHSPLASPNTNRSNSFLKNSPRYLPRTSSGRKMTMGQTIATNKPVLLAPSSLSPKTSGQKGSSPATVATVPQI